MEERILNKDQMKQRNWAKARILGFHIQDAVLTDKEIEEFEIVRSLLRQILHKWDENSQSMSRNLFKKYKCHYCGRRTNLKREVVMPGFENRYFCKKHFEQLLADSFTPEQQQTFTVTTATATMQVDETGRPVTGFLEF